MTIPDVDFIQKLFINKEHYLFVLANVGGDFHLFASRHAGFEIVS